jgi:hypothetical protein
MAHLPSSKNEKKLLKQQSGREYNSKTALGIVGGSNQEQRLFTKSPDRQNAQNAGYPATKE